MNLQDHVAQLRHHLTIVMEDPTWNVEVVAQYVGDLIDQDDASGGIVSVEVFDENHELTEMRRTLDRAFRVIGTGAIKMLEDGDGWERFRTLLAALRIFIEQSEQFTSPASDHRYREGEEDGYAVAMVQLKKIVEMYEGK